VIVSLLYKVIRKLLSAPSALLRSDAAKDAELLVLWHQNAVLRRQITGQVRYKPQDRFWFAALSSLLPRRRWHEIFRVQPATILAWHRRFIATKWDDSRLSSRGHGYPDRRTPGATDERPLRTGHQNPPQ
jgi:putative transposase